MVKTYKIVYEPVTTDDIKNENGEIIINGIHKGKWNIYYYGENDENHGKEFYSYDGTNCADGVEIRRGYIAKQT